MSPTPAASSTPYPTAAQASPSSSSPPHSLSRSATIGLGAGIGAGISIFLILTFLLVQSRLHRRRRRLANQETHYQRPFPPLKSSKDSSPCSSFESRRPNRRTLSLHEPPPVAMLPTRALPATALPTMPEATTALPSIAGTSTSVPTVARVVDTEQQDWTAFFQPVMDPTSHAMRVHKSRSVKVTTLSAIEETPSVARIRTESTSRPRSAR